MADPVGHDHAGGFLSCWVEPAFERKPILGLERDIPTSWRHDERKLGL
jgi:hypothetical protein